MSLKDQARITELEREVDNLKRDLADLRAAMAAHLQKGARRGTTKK
tara:strand:- start:1195 stop:1332 length:138 start_codon:yes stop_codon:yes gene_type:complete